jgi:FAD:protein FMN transferase
LAEGDAYAIAIDDPADAEIPATVVGLVAGALATSSRAKRHWTVDGEERHHLIDPATGAPAHTDVAAVTVIAHEATEAEIVAKAALVAGVDEGLELLRDARVAALLITADRSQHRVGGFEEHEQPKEHDR